MVEIKEMTDEELVVLVREKNKELYSEIVHRYQYKLAHYLRKFVKNGDELDDVEDYYIRNKKIVTMDHGYKAFSLLTPPIASPVAKRRIKIIMRDLLSGVGTEEEQGLGAFKTKTPHFVSVAIPSRLSFIRLGRAPWSSTQPISIVCNEDSKEMRGR